MVSRTRRSIAFDAKKKSREQFKMSSSAEKEFYRALKKVAQKSGHIVDIHSDGAALRDEADMLETLAKYSKKLEPWARRQSEKLLAKVLNSNKRAYNQQSKAMGKALQLGVASRETGQVAMALLNEQVALIQSIPLEAGLRAQKIAAENFIYGRRAVPDQSIVDQLKEEMGMSTEVAVNRAKLIARTEAARANASFTQARAQSVGSTHYRWITTMDGAERSSHAKMNGKIIAYNKPPTLSDGTTGHAGTFPNCRCYQEPILPSEVE